MRVKDCIALQGGLTRKRLDRFHLVADAIDRIPLHGSRADYAKQAIRDKRIEHKQYIVEHGEDMPEIRNWRWTSGQGRSKRRRSG